MDTDTIKVDRLLVLSEMPISGTAINARDAFALPPELSDPDGVVFPDTFIPCTWGSLDDAPWYFQDW